MEDRSPTRLVELADVLRISQVINFGVKPFELQAQVFYLLSLFLYLVADVNQEFPDGLQPLREIFVAHVNSSFLSKIVSLH
jgi:hypothetical protein